MSSVLFNWIWQGVALVAVVSLCLARARRVSASMRYRIWWATLVLVLMLPWLSALDFPGLGALLGFVTVASPVDAAVSTTPSRANDPSTSLALLALGGWLLWNIVRLYRAFAHLDAAKRACRPFPVVRERALSRWKAVRNRGRRATLAVSDHVCAAAVLGLGYPRIAVTAELVSTLADDELDQLVLHEYAHVQRRDDVASAIQLIVTAFAGWHPALWWIDRRLRIEREVACDDWVVAANGEARTYARCLTRVASVVCGSERPLLPAATRQRQLTTRVVRLLDGRRNISVRPSPAAFAAAALLLLVASVGLAGDHATVIALPRVLQASVAPTIDTPELTFARLLQMMSESSPARTTRIAQAAAAREREQAERTNDAIHAAFISIVDDYPSAAEISAAGANRVQAERLPDRQTTAPPSNTPTPAPSIANGAAVADVGSESAAEDGASDSWVDSTRRVLADAGKSTGQSIAGASISAGTAVADASIAAARSTQKSAAKAGRFFSRLGRTLARPF